jgi:hypothetical protein
MSTSETNPTTGLAGAPGSTATGAPESTAGAPNTLEVTGQVIDRAANMGRAGLTVKAMDASGTFQQPLATVTTDADGRFTFSFNYLQYNFKIPPDLFFNVFDTDGTTLLADTYDYVVWNGNQQESVTIYLYTAAPPTTGKDRVNSGLAVTIANFVRNSDFAGTFSDQKTKLGASVGVVWDGLLNSVINKIQTPLAVPVRSAAVVGTDVGTATRNLKDQNISVNQVMTYNPSLNSTSVKAVTGFIPALKPGQTVDLYQVNGQVKYYSIVQKDAAPATSTGSTPSNTLKLTDHATPAPSSPPARTEIIHAVRPASQPAPVAQPLDQPAPTLEAAPTPAPTKTSEAPPAAQPTVLTTSGPQPNGTQPDATAASAPGGQTSGAAPSPTALQVELEATRQAVSQKDQQIAILLQELDAIRKDQSEIKALLKGKFPS